MKRAATHSFFAILAASLALSGCQSMKAPSLAPKPVKQTVRMTLAPVTPLAAGKTSTVNTKLINIEQEYALNNDDLETVHTQKFHLLVVDPTLTDYQHIHPQPTQLPGLYSFSFTPKLPGGYLAWADITPTETKIQEFVRADLGKPRGNGIDRTERSEAVVEGYHFTLSFDKKPAKGDESVGTVHITDSAGRPVTALQPIMGTYGHIVGFYDDLKTVVHTHPLGATPESESDHGGPDLTFHLEPSRAGFVKLFAQVRIGGKEMYAPFGVAVAKE